MTEERKAHIEAAIAAQEAQGRRWSNQSIFAEVRGSYRELNRYLRDRRAAERGDFVAFIEALEPEPEPASAPLPVVVPPVPPVAGTGALAHLRRRYYELLQTAYGTAPGSFEQQELARCQAEFAQQCAAARQCLARARRLAPLVRYEQSQAANLATGTADPAAYVAQMAHGTTPQAALYRSALAVLEQFVGVREARRLVATTDEPRWSLLHG